MPSSFARRNRLRADIDDTIRAKFLRQLEPPRVDIGDHDISRARMLDDGGRHATDRAGSRNQHVFAEHRKRQSRVNRVAKRIKDRCNIAVDGSVVMPNVGHRQRNEFGKRARAVDADSLSMGT